MLRLPIELGMKGRSKLKSSTKTLLEILPKLRSELGTTIGDNEKRHSMQLYHFLELQLGIVFLQIGNLDGKEMIQFRYPIYYCRYL